MKRIAAILCVVLSVSPAVMAQSQSRSGSSRPATSASQTRKNETPVRPVSRNQDGDQRPAAASEKSAPAAASGAGNTGGKPAIAAPRLPEMLPGAEKQMDDLLMQWSQASARIKRLEGRHLRIVYDLTFETESQSEGEFGYEQPDKGRIDVSPVPITQELIDARKAAAELPPEKRTLRVRLKESGEPFTLVLAQRELWSCDGQRVYSVDIDKKEAMVAELSAEMQGDHIMDSPLPFLFGMPPDKARERFELAFFDGKLDPKSGKVKLMILPKQKKDSQNWSRADVLLDLKNFLPIAVQMFDPAETKITVYQFYDFKVNGSIFERIRELAGAGGFTPRLKGINIVSTGPSQAPLINEEQKMALRDPSEGVTPLVNVEGLSWKDAQIQLQRQGIERTKVPETNRLILVEGEPAKSKDQIFTVKEQSPAPGTPITPSTKVRLVIYTDPESESTRK